MRGFKDIAMKQDKARYLDIWFIIFPVTQRTVRTILAPILPIWFPFSPSSRINPVASDPLPLLEFLLQMNLQLAKPISKPLPTAPTSKILRQIPLSTGMSPWIILCQRKIIQIDKERGVEAIVMFAVPHPITDKVPGQDMDM